MTESQPATTTLAIAAGTQVEHASVIKLVRSYQGDLEEFGGVRFEIAPFETAGGTQQREIAILNEHQASFPIVPFASATNSGVLTMSSREIAELTGKEHKNVLADIRKMLESLKFDSAEFSAQYKDSTGRSLPEFRLPKDLTITLVSGYNVQVRHRIVTRWMELEEKARTPEGRPNDMLLTSSTGFDGWVTQPGGWTGTKEGRRKGIRQGTQMPENPHQDRKPLLRSVSQRIKG